MNECFRKLIGAGTRFGKFPFLSDSIGFAKGSGAMDGILPLWKPAGMTSHDCVFKIRKLFGTKKQAIPARLIRMWKGSSRFASGVRQRLPNTFRMPAKLTKVKQRSGFQRRQKMLPAISLKKGN